MFFFTLITILSIRCRSMTRLQLARKQKEKSAVLFFVVVPSAPKVGWSRCCTASSRTGRPCWCPSSTSSTTRRSSTSTAIRNRSRSAASPGRATSRGWTCRRAKSRAGPTPSAPPTVPPWPADSSPSTANTFGRSVSTAASRLRHPFKHFRSKYGMPIC